MSYRIIDPTLEHNLGSPTKPWALSPFISTMPYLMHARIDLPPEDSSSPNITCLPTWKASSTPFPPPCSIKDDTSQLHLASIDNLNPSPTGSVSSSASSVYSVSSEAPSFSSATSHSSNQSKKSLGASDKLKKVIQVATRKRHRPPPSCLNFETADQRQSYFRSVEHRRQIYFGPEVSRTRAIGNVKILTDVVFFSFLKDLITTDFCHGFLEFHPTLLLRLPAGLSFNLMPYWDGQPVTFVCCLRKDAVSATKNDENPWGTIFWCVSIKLDNADDTSNNSVEDEID